ncbi:MAG: U32 family peptidase [Rikenellaceae bacterium]
MKYQRTIELLAPAANFDVAVAAIQAGADAIYIGAEKFSARSAAGNSLADIERLCSYAHPFGVRVYLALNTLMESEGELREAEELARAAVRCGVDAIIFQDVRFLDMDLGVEMHASTQTAQFSPQRALEFERAGVSRIVLERGLSLAEIREIGEAVSVELEVFVHGAICVGYSGICNLSEHLTGRSGNRGQCAQPCRSLYDMVDGTSRVMFRGEALLSPRDLNLSERLCELLAAGVTSLKIEGRLKDRDYVSNVVAYYHRLLEGMGVGRQSWGRVSHGFEPDLRLSFNRGFTQWYFDGVEKHWGESCLASSVEGVGEYIGRVRAVGRDFVDVSLEGGVCMSNGDGLFFRDSMGRSSGVRVNRASGNRLYLLSLEGISEGMPLYRNSRANWSTESERRVEVSVSVLGGENGDVEFRAESIGGCRYSVVLRGGEYEVSRDYERGCSVLSSGLRKSGGTMFAVVGVSIDLEEVPFLSSSVINSYRRELLEGLRGELSEYSLSRFSVGEYGGYAGLENMEVGYLMRSRYCIMREKGMCLREGGGGYRAPFYLVNNNRRLLLRFDCKECFMYIERG